jgi:hypothetical protein
MTVSSGTVPATGNPVIYTDADTVITGLKKRERYFVIKQSATTFKLATTKENALNGIAIDLTAKGSGGNNRFYMYTLVDFGASHVNSAGAIAPTGDTEGFYQEFVFGYDVDDTDLTTNDAFCVITPLLENRGYAVIPKIFSQEITSQGKLTIRYRPLDTEDKIILKKKDNDVLGLPVSTVTDASATDATWFAKNIVVTTQNISEAKTHVDNGFPLELEVLSGAGAGQFIQVASISENSGTYSIVLEEDAEYVNASDKCGFVLDNWETIGCADSDVDDNYVQFSDLKASKFALLKLELRGYGTTVEDIDYKESPNIKGQ